MAQVRAFAAIRYDHARLGGDLSDVVAPPYDVLDQADKRKLLARSDRNVVAIDLPHIPPKSAGPSELYQAAAEKLARWLEDGTLIREQQPALYLYHQIFEHGGKTYTRRKFITQVRLVPFSEGVILPHEETFGGPKADRLALTEATRCNTSAVFGLYTDPNDTVSQAFDRTATREPDATARMDGVENRMWIETDPGVIKTVTEAMAPKRIFIADGHHRYGTALTYRSRVIEQSGGVADDHPVNFVMLVLGSMDDPGSLILPYNRVLLGSDASVEKLTSAWSSACRPAEGAAADLTLYSGTDGSEHPLLFTARPQLKALEPQRSDAWCSLDATYLHRYLLDELGKGLELSVRYVKSAEKARIVAREQQGVALLVNATKMEQLRAVSEGGELMPQKSTFFYPKLATGLTISPLS